MNITIECAHCHKRYNAPASLAGKRVKCKHCGKVFAIPAQNDESAEFSDLDNLLVEPEQPAEPSPEVDQPPAQAAGMNKPGPGIRRPAGGNAPSRGKDQEAAGENDDAKPLGHPSKGYAARIDRKEGAADVGLAGEAPSLVSLRPNVPFDFPGSDLLDGFGPIVLTILGLGWLAIMAVNSNLTGVSWVGTFRMGLYIGLYFIVAFPIGYLGLRWTARKVRFAMPPAAPGRAIGAFALPFAVALSLWLAGESIPMLIFGTLLGTIIACGAVWLLFRIQPLEIPTVCGMTTACFAIAVMASYVLMLLVNMAMAASASPEKNLLADSPVGPTFAWNVPVKSKDGDHPVVAQTSESATGPATEPTVAPETQPTTNPDTPATTQAVIVQTQPTTGMATNVDNPPAATRETAMATQPVDPPMTQRVTPDTVATTGPSMPVSGDVANSSPLVAKVTAAAGPSGFDVLNFAAGNAPFVAAVKTGQDEDIVELWGTQPIARKAFAKFAREKDVKTTYALAANGDWLGRISTWPKLAIAVWSFAAEKDAKVAAMNASRMGTPPQMFGFAAMDTVVLNLMKSNPSGFEVVNVKMQPPQQVAFLDLDTFEMNATNPLISPDGRTMAVACVDQGKAGIHLWDLTAKRAAPARTLPVPLTTWVKPAGMAFSADGKSLAAFFEQRGRGLLMNYRVVDGKVVQEHVYPSLPLPQDVFDAQTEHSRTLEFLGDGSGWLLCGRLLIDLETGKSLGTLDVEDVRSLHALDKETLLLVTGEGQSSRVLVVKLKSEAIAAARAAVRAKTPK